MLPSLIFMTVLAAQSAVEATTAPAQAPPPPAASAPAKPEKPKKVCVEEPQIGSHFRRRICATPEEWERRRLRDAEILAEPGGRAPSAGGGPR